LTAVRISAFVFFGGMIGKKSESKGRLNRGVNESGDASRSQKRFAQKKPHHSEERGGFE
jgi:hypothetical protein